LLVSRLENAKQHRRPRIQQVYRKTGMFMKYTIEQNEINKLIIKPE